VGQLNGSGIRSVRPGDELIRVLERNPEFRAGLGLVEVRPQQFREYADLAADQSGGPEPRGIP